MKKLFTTMALSACVMYVMAGGLLTNTNQHAAFIRNPARNASLGIDAVYYNPAGTAFLKEGWAFSANWQMIWQDRDAYDCNNENKKYHGSIYVPCMPTLMAAYSKNDWTFSAFFGMPGGGGECNFDDGLPSFTNMAADLFNLQTQGMISGFNAASKFTSNQYLFALQLGAAYKITDCLSAYAGIRANYTTNGYEGGIDITLAEDNPAAAITGTHPLDLDLDMEQTGIAFAPILGLDYKTGDFNFGVKYEFRAVTTLENDTKVLSYNGNDIKQEQALNQYMPALAGFADGNKLRADAPSILTLGASWKPAEKIQLMAGCTYYFDKDAKVESLMGGDNMRKLSKNTIEYQLGAEYRITDKWMISAGIQYSDYGVNDRYISDLAFVNDAFMTALGAEYAVSQKVKINMGLVYSNYAPDYCESATSQRTTLYKRKTYNASVGVDFEI